MHSIILAFWNQGNNLVTTNIQPDSMYVQSETSLTVFNRPYSPNKYT